MEEQVKEEVLELDQEQLEALLGANGSDNDNLPPIQIDMEDYDCDEFQRGIDETSYIAGVITAMLNTGGYQSFVLDYLLNKETIKHNIRTAELNRDMNIEIAKNQKIIAEKHEL